MTQAFLPLLLKAKGMIVNQTSIASIVPLPFSSAYHASKAAVAMFSEHQRLELAPFGIKVVEMKTGTVKSLINVNGTSNGGGTLPNGSMYTPIKDDVEKVMRGDHFDDWQDPSTWATAVVRDLLRRNPPTQIWRGGGVWPVWLTSFGKHTWIDGTLRHLTGLDKLEAKLKSKGIDSEGSRKNIDPSAGLTG